MSSKGRLYCAECNRCLDKIGKKDIVNDLENDWYFHKPCYHKYKRELSSNTGSTLNESQSSLASSSPVFVMDSEFNIRERMSWFYDCRTAAAHETCALVPPCPQFLLQVIRNDSSKYDGEVVSNLNGDQQYNFMTQEHHDVFISASSRLKCNPKVSVQSN